MICTGFSYPNPIRDSNALTLADRKKGLQEFYDKCENAKSILIAGAGVVGIELAAELVHKYGEKKIKKIGLCLRGDRLLPNCPEKAGILAAQYLASKGLEIMYKTPLTD